MTGISDHQVNNLPWAQSRAAQESRRHPLAVDFDPAMVLEKAGYGCRIEERWWCHADWVWSHSARR